MPGGLCLFGGVTDTGSSNETWVYDLEKRVWKYIFAENIIKAKAVDEQNVQDEVDLAFPYARYEAIFSPSFVLLRCGLVLKLIRFENVSSFTEFNCLSFMISIRILCRCGHVGLLSPFDPFRMFIFGGVNIESGAYLSDVWQLSSGSSPSWAEVPQGGIKPTARWHHTATALEDKIFVYGGASQSLKFDSLPLFLSSSFFLSLSHYLTLFFLSFFFNIFPVSLQVPFFECWKFC